MKGIRDIVTIIVGIAIIVAFGYFIKVLLQHLGDSEPQWSRLVFIYGGVEAAGLAAIGFFFGKEVNRARAEGAEARAKEAETAARTAENQRAKAKQRLFDLASSIEEMNALKPADRNFEYLIQYTRRLVQQQE